MDINEYLNTMVDKDASDLYLTALRPPVYRIEGKTKAIGDLVFESADLEN